MIKGSEPYTMIWFPILKMELLSILDFSPADLTSRQPSGMDPKSFMQLTNSISQG